MQTNLDVTIVENQTATIKNKTMLHTLYTIRDVIDVSYKLKSNLILISLNFLEPFTG